MLGNIERNVQKQITDDSMGSAISERSQGTGVSADLRLSFVTPLMNSRWPYFLLTSDALNSRHERG